MYLRETSNKTISVCLLGCSQYLKINIIIMITLYVICAEDVKHVALAPGEGDSLQLLKG